MVSKEFNELYNLSAWQHLSLLKKSHQHPASFILEQAPAVPAVAFDLQVLLSLRKLIRAADIFSRRLIREHNISGPQLMCLHELLDHDGMTVSQLSKEIFLSPSTVVGILDRLEKQELVKRVRSEEDRRKVMLSVTQAGRQLVEDAPPPLHNALQDGLSQLTLKEQESIAQSMQKLVEILEIQNLDAAPILEVGEQIIADTQSGMNLKEDEP